MAYSRRRAVLAVALNLVAAAVLFDCSSDPDQTASTPDSGPDTAQADSPSGIDSSANDAASDTTTPTDAGLDVVDAAPVIPTVYGVDTLAKLIRFSVATPNILSLTVTVSGLKPADALIGIDFRPADGVLYGVGQLGYVYTIDKATGAATAVSDTAFVPLPSGASFAMDFNPAVDRIRLISNAGQNLRINPTTGALSAADTAMSYAIGDLNQGAVPGVTSAAYTNNVSPAPATTIFYAIDTTTHALVTSTNPNSGMLVTVGPLGMNPNGFVGFDIYGGVSGDGGTPANDKPMSAYAVFSTGAGLPALYRINLGTGAATKVGDIGHPNDLAGIAIEP